MSRRDEYSRDKPSHSRESLTRPNPFESNRNEYRSNSSTRPKSRDFRDRVHSNERGNSYGSSRHRKSSPSLHRSKQRSHERHSDERSTRESELDRLATRHKSSSTSINTERPSGEASRDLVQSKHQTTLQSDSISLTKTSSSSQQNESQTECNKSPPYDPTLDVTSPEFDPIKTLYSSAVKLPYPKAKIYDNVSVFEARLLKKHLLPKKPKEETITAPPVPIERRFAPEQMMVAKPAPSRRHIRNILNPSQRLQGPTAKLKEYIQTGQYIKVYTRKQNGIAGYVIGQLKAFDRYWNLLFVDVTEVYERRKPSYSKTAMGCGDDIDECAQRLMELNIQLPRVKVKSLDRKTVRCIRDLKSLVVAGEQVVSVVTNLPTEHGLPRIKLKKLVI